MGGYCLEFFIGFINGNESLEVVVFREFEEEISYKDDVVECFFVVCMDLGSLNFIIYIVIVVINGDNVENWRFKLKLRDGEFLCCGVDNVYMKFFLKF